MKDSEGGGSDKKSKVPVYFSLIVISAGVLAYFVIPEFQIFLQEAWNVLSSGNEQRIKEWVSRFGWIGPAVIILAMILQMFLIVIPSFVLMVVAVLAYGPVLGSIISFVAIFSASSIGYFVGKFFGKFVVEKLIGEKQERKLEDFISDYGFWAVFVVRLNPMLSNDAISFAGGLLGMGYWRFIGASLLGITPLTIFIAFLGENNERLKTGLFWGSIVGLAIYLFYIWWDRNRRKKTKDNP